MVGKLVSYKFFVLIFFCSSKFLSSSPCSSKPIEPTHVTFAPNSERFFATFPAPPGVEYTSSGVKTGTFASGEILVESHKTY